MPNGGRVTIATRNVGAEDLGDWDEPVPTGLRWIEIAVAD